MSPNPHPLTQNPKSRLVNPMIKIHFYHLIKLIFVIFFIENYFCDKNLKNDILQYFSIITYLYPPKENLLKVCITQVLKQYVMCSVFINTNY